jgi:hypothetical protein
MHNDSSSSQITVVVLRIHAEFSVTSDDETGLTLFHVYTDRELASAYMDIFTGVGNQQILFLLEPRFIVSINCLILWMDVFVWNTPASRWTVKTVLHKNRIAVCRIVYYLLDTCICLIWTCNAFHLCQYMPEMHHILDHYYTNFLAVHTDPSQ